VSITTTQNLHHRALGKLEEATRHPKVPTGSSRRGSAAVKGAQGARATTIQTSPQRLQSWEATTRLQQPRVGAPSASPPC
jgi:hypothetical protein